MEHSFSTEVAKDVGVIPAILFGHILYWVRHNEANGTNFYDGKYWMYNSNKAFQLQFEYLSKGQIERAIETLKERGYIIVGNYNSVHFDRTLWFSLGETGNAFPENEKCISRKQEMHFPKTGNAFPENEKCISRKQEMHFPKTGNAFPENGKSHFPKTGNLYQIINKI